MSATYFTSDTHYNHTNLCRGVSKWLDRDGDVSSTRDFPTLEAMNKALVDGINQRVGPDDILYFLGDCVAWALSKPRMRLP